MKVDMEIRHVTRPLYPDSWQLDFCLPIEFGS